MVPGTACSLQHAVPHVWPWWPHFSIPITVRTTPNRSMVLFGDRIWLLFKDFWHRVNASVHTL